jgi:signal transduction histidine kinase/CheY-like chemotaxis protein
MSFVDERILILTSTQKDSESTRKLLQKWDLKPHVCSRFEDLIHQISQGAGALLIAKEILIGSNLEHLIDILAAQESWSDLPVIVLASAGDLTEGNAQAIQVLRNIRNTTVLERPVRIATLMSILESAIANRKRQYEVRNLFTDLVEARKEADRANKTKSQFLANMSHEIRTPLGIILGFSEFALDDSSSAEERRKYFEAIQKNGRILLELVNDILDLAKVEAGHISIENIDSSLLDILKDVTANFQAIASKKNVEIILKVPDQFADRVKTDPTRIRQIFTNVLGNAVKFTDQGSIVCEVSCSKQSDDKNKYSIKVIDTGLGIAPEQLEKIFQPFSQADSSMTRKFGGTGLGLVLSKKLAQVLGGDLTLIETTLGKGSTFEISFQAEKTNAINLSHSFSTKTNSSQAVAGLNVLLAEDSADNQFIVSRILNQAGVHVELANNGEEAVDKALKGRYDVVLMDIQMPQVDGREATTRLRKKGYRSPIIALTANALKGDREKALLSGFDDYITKPIQKNELFDSLARYKSFEHKL